MASPRGGAPPLPPPRTGRPRGRRLPRRRCRRSVRSSRRGRRSGRARPCPAAPRREPRPGCAGGCLRRDGGRGGLWRDGCGGRRGCGRGGRVRWDGCGGRLGRGRGCGRGGRFEGCCCGGRFVVGRRCGTQRRRGSRLVIAGRPVSSRAGRRGCRIGCRFDGRVLSGCGHHGRLRAFIVGRAPREGSEPSSEQGQAASCHNTASPHHVSAIDALGRELAQSGCHLGVVVGVDRAQVCDGGAVDHPGDDRPRP